MHHSITRSKLMLWVFPVLFAMQVTAEDAIEETTVAATGDSASYFLRSAVQSDNPWGTPKGPVGGESPLVIWEGDNNSFLRASFKGDIAFFDQSDSWFGEAQANLGENSSNWWENTLRPGLDGSYGFDNKSAVYARLSAVAGATQNIDAAGSNVPWGDTSHIAVEDAYVGWRSGEVFGRKDLVDVSFGSQQYIAGTGFLFYSQSSNGKNRGAYWIGGRHNAEYAAIARFNVSEQLKADAVYFKANDNPDSDTKVGGINFDYSISEKIGSVGGGYFSVDSEIATRDGMDVWDARFSVTPFKAFGGPEVLDPFTLDGEYVNEDNGDAMSADGWYLSGEYSWDDVTWSPSATYRYAAFEGDNPNSAKSENFDPLFYGFSDWGYWFQGEILGEYVLSNSNLNSHMLRITFAPTEEIGVNLFAYHFELDDAEGFGVGDSSFADEFNVTLDWTPTDYFSMSLVGAYAKPDDGAKEYTGGSEDWYYGMIYVSYAFK